jgi:hypothetical protein
MADIQKSIRDTKHYAQALFEGGRDTLAVAVAGAIVLHCKIIQVSP